MSEQVFECEHCGDGDALREGESCAYCGLDKGDEADVNADLLGFQFQIEGKTWTVTKTPVWSAGNYVTIECEDGTQSARAAGLVRQRMQGIS